MEIRRIEQKLVNTVVEVKIICDKCGEQIKTTSFDAFECIFELRQGSQFPEGGSGTKRTLDLCENCGEQAVDLLNANGFKIQTNDFDY